MLEWWLSCGVKLSSPLQLPMMKEVATTSFLNTVKTRVPRQSLIVQREKTKLTILHNWSIKTICNSVSETFAPQPSLNGLKIHIANNSSNLFLSHSDRQAALNFKNKDAPAFDYPVWTHIPYEPTVNGGRGGFDMPPLQTWTREKFLTL